MRSRRGELGLALLLATVACGDDRPPAADVAAAGSPVLVENDYIRARSSWWVSAESGDRGTEWRQPGYLPYQHDGWPAMTAPLGYGETYVNPIPYGSDPNHKPPTVYFSGPLWVNDPSRVVSLRLDMMYDDGFVLYLNGIECRRASMPSGTVSYTTLALGHEANDAYEAFDITGCKGSLLTGSNSVSIEVHQVSVASSDLVFDAALTAIEEQPRIEPSPGGIPRRSGWAYWDRGGDLGSAWRAGAYDDSSWNLGSAPLGYGETYLATTVSYGPNAASKYITTYFRKQFTVSDPAAVGAIAGELMYDDGVVVYLNGHLIGAAGMPAGATTASTLALGHEANNVYEGFDWTAQKPLLVAGVNTIAVEVHQVNGSSSDLVFDLSLRLDTAPPPAPSSIPPRSAWKYRDHGENLGTAWRAATFDDSAWASGTGPLGYGEDYLSSTLSFGPDAANKYITTYFRKKFVVDLPAGFAVTDLKGQLMYDDGIVVYVNGQELQRASMPTGTVSSSTLALGHEAGNVYESFDWSALRSLVHAGENTLAVEVHQAAATSSDLVFDLALDVITAPLFTRFAGNPILGPSQDQFGPTAWRYGNVYSPDVFQLPSGSWLMYYTANDGGGPHDVIGRAVSTNGVDWTFDDDFLLAASTPSVVFDGSVYRMWHIDDYDDGIFLATSSDGVHWTDGQTPVIAAGDGPEVLLDGTQWKMWYSLWDGQAFNIHYATSADGVSWTPHGQVLSGGSNPSVIHSGGQYEMWFTSSIEGIRYATSTDGVTWTRRGLSLAAAAGSWDANVESATVVRGAGGARMWYGVYGPRAGGLGYATSP
jgi:hypothetical protein